MIKKNNKKLRLHVFKSNKHIYASLIDDNSQKIITSSSTISKSIKKQNITRRNCNIARIIGKEIGVKLKKLGIQEIIFDRGKNVYHGQIKAVAEGTREEGITF
uniref:Large ribosomal subunit protein uL18c n=1 Tax=Polysiphonia sertularioides TaxID=945028 RepID=A0A1Z1MG33_9FLOR|nr:ribosomal protein L18 [Polysiphonia sertularioides]